MQHPDEYHVPVLLDEVLEDLDVRPSGRYCDGTSGTGGHAAAILERLAPTGRLICIDQDPDVIEIARTRLGGSDGPVLFVRDSFHRLGTILADAGFSSFDGILLDLGLNSWTLAQKGSGLSYQIDAPLDMAVDPDVPHDAREFLERSSEEEIARVLFDYGDLRRSRLYARRIVEARERGRLATTGDLVRAVGGGRATGASPGELSRVFQALRVEVLQEMERLESFLDHVGDWIHPGGRLCVITYASHEDRRVKRFSNGEGSGERFTPLRKRPRVPSSEEVRRNRRSRSAKLRSFVRG